MEIGRLILKTELPNLGRAAFASSRRDLGVEHVRAAGLQVSDRISDGVQVHPLAPIYVPYPNWKHKKRVE